MQYVSCSKQKVEKEKICWIWKRFLFALRRLINVKCLHKKTFPMFQTCKMSLNDAMSLTNDVVVYQYYIMLDWHVYKLEWTELRY